MPSSGFASSGQTLFTPGLAQQDGNGQHFYQVDALGSVRGVSGNNQAPLGEVYFDAFGLASLRQGSQPSPLGFAGAAGYQTDADTGLMLLGNRYYDPSIGRFLSPDKVYDGNNWYAYCGNDPLTRTDPTGNLYQDSPTNHTSEGEMHAQLEGFREGIAAGDGDGWNQGSMLDQLNRQLNQQLQQQAQEQAMAQMSAMVLHGGGLAGAFGGTYDQMDGSFATGYSLADANRYAGKNSPYGEPTFDFNFTRDDWHDIFSTEANIGKYESAAGSLILGINNTGKNPNFIQGTNNPLITRNPWVQMIGVGLVIGGSFSYIVGSYGAYETGP